MRKILFFLFLITYSFSRDCSYFETLKKNYCSRISLGSGTCVYGTTCSQQNTPTYTQCGSGEGQYNGDDEKICNSLEATENKNKCEVVSGHCTEVLRECSEWKSLDTCTDLKVDNDDNKKRCIKDGEECKEHYKDCEEINNKDACLANIPLKDKSVGNSGDALQNCVWDGSHCKKFDDCGDYKAEDYDGEINQDVCNLIKPLKEGVIDVKSKCDKDEEDKCSSRPLKCGEYPTTIQCSLRNPSVDTNKCIELDGKCIELPKACGSYEGNVQKECEKITELLEDDTKKCVYEKDKCKEQNKNQCSEFKKSDTCQSFTAPEHKKCVFVNSKCEEVYKSCEELNSDSSISNKESVCQSILLYTTTSGNTIIDYSKECEYSTTADSSDTKICHSKNIAKCEDYDYTSKEFCKNIELTDDKKNCAMINGKCTEQPNGCVNSPDGDKKTCESIVLDNENEKCVMENDNKCQPSIKYCSEYKENIESECKKYVPLDKANKVCSIYNGNCIEQFKYCSDYRGDDHTYCESIVPYSEGNIDVTSKCVYDSSVGCMKQLKSCKDASDFDECEAISEKISEDSTKKCSYFAGKCQEDYKTCSDYKVEEGNVDTNTCINIKYTGSDFGYIKCEVKTGKCEPKVETACSDFQPDFISEKCEEIIPEEIQFRCVYSNGNCSQQKKLCSEISSAQVISENICSEGTVSDSSKKSCVLTSDKKGCEEVDKTNNQEGGSDNGNNSGSSTGENENNNNNNNNSNSEKIMVSYLLIMFSLLF